MSLKDLDKQEGIGLAEIERRGPGEAQFPHLQGHASCNAKLASFKKLSFQRSGR
jgi:hypothetical protein